MGQPSQDWDQFLQVRLHPSEGSWREQASGDRQLPELGAGHRLAGEHIEGPAEFDISVSKLLGFETF